MAEWRRDAFPPSRACAPECPCEAWASHSSIERGMLVQTCLTTCHHVYSGAITSDVATNVTSNCFSVAVKLCYFRILLFRGFCEGPDFFISMKSSLALWT